MFCTVILPPFSYACFLDDTLPPVFLVSLCHCIIKSAYKYLFTVLHVSYFLLQFPSLYWASLHHKLLEKLLFCSHFSNLYSLLNQLVFNPQNSTECSLEKMLVSSHQSQCRLFCARIVWLLSSIQHPWPSPGRNTFLFFAWHTGYYTFMVFFWLLYLSSSYPCPILLSVLIVKTLITSGQVLASSFFSLRLLITSCPFIGFKCPCFFPISHIKTASWIGLLVSLVQIKLWFVCML